MNRIELELIKCLQDLQTARGAQILILKKKQRELEQALKAKEDLQAKEDLRSKNTKEVTKAKEGLPKATQATSTIKGDKK